MLQAILSSANSFYYIQISRVKGWRWGAQQDRIIIKQILVDPFDRGCTPVLHQALNAQLAEKNYQVLTRSRDEICVQGLENRFVLEAETIGGGFSVGKESIDIRLIYYKLLHRKRDISANYGELDTIRSCWDTENYFDIKIKVSGKNEQKVREHIPGAIKKALKKHFAK